MPTIVAPPRIGIRNILFATDLDVSAQAALFCAVDLARRYGAALYTVNVMPHLPFVEATEPDPEQLKLAAMQKLAALAEPLQGIKQRTDRTRRSSGSAFQAGRGE